MSEHVRQPAKPAAIDTSPIEHEIVEKRVFAILARLLLACGIVAPVLFFATDLIAGVTRWGYSFATQSMSVLSAPGAPTRPLVLGLDVVTYLAVIAFAVGMWLSADPKRSLRAIAGLLLTSAALQLVAVVLFPFRPNEPTSGFANTMNVALMAPSIVGWFLAIVLGAVAFRNWFRFLSLALLLALFVEDLLATAGASLFVAGGHSGSLVGIQERAMAYGFYVWLALLVLVQSRAWLEYKSRRRV